MSALFESVKQNLSFLGVCILIIAALSIIAHLLERYLLQKRDISPTRRLTIIAMCSVIAMVLHILDFPVGFAPGFYKLDFSELPVLLCGFYIGPSASVACEAIKILLKLLFKSTSTAFVGDFANFVVGCSMVIPAVTIYHVRRSRVSAVVGLVVGTLCMTVFGSAFNAVYLLPKFAELYGMPLDVIVGMGTAINSAITSVSTLVLLAVAPLNLLKGTAVGILTMLLYKRVARPLFGIRTQK